MTVCYLRLHGSSFSVVDGYLREYVLSDDFNSDTETQQMFQFLCDRTIIDVQEYRIYYDYEDKDNNINEFGEIITPDDLSDVAIVLDNGVRLVCNMFFDYFDIRIIE